MEKICVGFCDSNKSVNMKEEEYLIDIPLTPYFDVFLLFTAPADGSNSLGLYPYGIQPLCCTANPNLTKPNLK